MKIQNENNYDVTIGLIHTSIHLPANSILEIEGTINSKLPKGVKVIKEVLGEIDPYKWVTDSTNENIKTLLHG